MSKLVLLLLLLLASAASAYGQRVNNSDCGRFEAFAGYSNHHVETESFDEFERLAGLPAAQVATNFGVSSADLNSGIKDAFRSGRNLNGINVSVTKYFRKCLGLVASFAYERSDHTRSIANNQVFFENLSEAKRKRYDFLVGPQLKFQQGRVEPFVHALVGVARQNNAVTLSFQNNAATPPNVPTIRLRDNYTAFTASIGGGIDIGVNTHLAIRVIQVEYTPVFTRHRDARLVAPTATGADGASLGQTTFLGSRRDGLRISVGVVFR